MTAITLRYTAHYADGTETTVAVSIDGETGTYPDALDDMCRRAVGTYKEAVHDAFPPDIQEADQAGEEGKQ